MSDRNASMITAFKYTLETILMIGTKSYNIPMNSIKSIMINYDYDKNTMPIIYLGIRVSSTLYNLMVNNAETATMSFRLFKFDDKANSTVSEPYIEDNFSYVMPSDPNYNEVMEKVVSDSSYSNTDNADSYLDGYIALTSIKSIADNMKLFNTIVKDTDIMSVVHTFTHHLNMCIEPFDNTDQIDQFIIPPITSITKLLSFLNRNYSFYKSGYRYFRGFSTTYLLSTRGKAIGEGSNKFDTVIISICDPLNYESKSNAIELDRKNHAYIIYVDANDTSLKLDKYANKMFNSLITVDTQGNSIESELDVIPTPDSTQKVLFDRNSNLDIMYKTKGTIESSSIIVTIHKTEIDSTILTPNKKYQIKHYSDSRKYDGTYLLSYKKEMLRQQGNVYIGNVLFGLRKATES